MKKLVYSALLAAVAAAPATALAGNVGGCGWGSKLFDGQRGIAPQVLAVTTNGTSGNQTFAITSGTSGCSQDGVVRSQWKTAMFIDSNMNKLAKDAAVGNGESLEALATLLGVQDEHKGQFFAATQDNFGKLFSSSEVTSQEVLASLIEVLSADEVLQAYAPVA